MMIRCALACCMAVLLAAGDTEEGNETQLEGMLVPAERAVIDLWLEAYRDELLVLEAAENGSFVNEGDVLIRFDTRRIDEQLR